VSAADESEQAQTELCDLTDHLARLQQTNPGGSKGSTKAGLRKMIAGLHEELAAYEGSEEIRTPVVKWSDKISNRSPMIRVGRLRNSGRLDLLTAGLLTAGLLTAGLLAAGLLTAGPPQNQFRVRLADVQLPHRSVGGTVSGYITSDAAFAV